MVNRLALIALLPIALAGCPTFQAKFGAAQSVLEEISTAPLMTCAVVVQQSQMVLNKLATGTVIAPAIAPAPTTTSPPPVNAPIMTMPGTSPANLP